jgi:hypothetical protein
MNEEPLRAMVLAWCLVRESLSELVKFLPETGRDDAAYDAAVENARVLHRCRAIDEQILLRVSSLDELSATLLAARAHARASLGKQPRVSLRMQKRC